MEKHVFSLLFEALGRKSIGKPLVFIAFRSSGRETYWKSICFHCFLKLWEGKVLENHWFSLLFEALGRKSIRKQLVFIAFRSSGKEQYWKTIGLHCFSKLWEERVLENHWFSLPGPPACSAQVEMDASLTLTGASEH